MAKKVIGEIKLQIPAGQANPSPPVGPALGQRGVNIMEFCKSFNAATQAQQGMITPVIITVYADRSFTFVTKTPPASVLLKKAAGIEKGSAEPGKDSRSVRSPGRRVRQIAELKLKDLTAKDLAAAEKSVEGTARSLRFGSRRLVSAAQSFETRSRKAMSEKGKTYRGGARESGSQPALSFGR